MRYNLEETDNDESLFIIKDFEYNKNHTHTKETITSGTAITGFQVLTEKKTRLKL